MCDELSVPATSELAGEVSDWSSELLRVLLVSCFRNILLILQKVLPNHLLSWLHPSWQLSTRQPLARFPLLGWGENWKGKSEKTRGLR